MRDGQTQPNGDATRRITRRGRGMVAAVAALGLAVPWSGCGSSAGAAASWTVGTSPLPAGASGGGLAAVSCTSATNCLAVGDYSLPTPGSHKTLAVRWNGSKWSVVTSPNPKGVRSSKLLGVSCPSPTRCFAVGTYTSSTPQTLVERWDGTRWAIMSSPERAGATDSQLFGVSCTSSSNCVAVGRYKGPSSLRKTLIERWNGQSWTIVASPNAKAGNNYLYGVSCASATSCFAVGTYYHSSDCEPELDCGASTLAVRWNGTKWTVVASLDANLAFQSTLAGVSCATATSCVAVGTSYPNPQSSWKMLTERWNGTKWSLVAGAIPAGVTRSVLSGVSCPSPTTCFAGGASQKSGDDYPLVERYNGSSWSVAFRVSRVGSLRGVSCTSATSCVAVGNTVIARLRPA